MCAKRNESKRDSQFSSDQGCKGHAVRAQVRRRAHRGMRALGADSRRRQHRRETRRGRRQVHRASQHPSTTPIEQRLATLLAQKNDTDFKLCVRPNYSAKKLFPSDTTRVIHYNLEGLPVLGRLHELCTLMSAWEWLLAAISEAGCPGTAFFTSGEYWVLQSGQVAFVFHKSLSDSLVNFIPKTDRVAALQFKTLGGMFSIICTYVPYEIADNEAERIATYEAMEEMHLEYARRGPTLCIGDMNTKIQYRHQSECKYFGPCLFTPLPRNEITIGDGEEKPDGITVARVAVYNRDLLSQYCTATGAVVRNTFLDKSLRHKVTFYARGARRPIDRDHLDFTIHRELGHTMISGEYAYMVQDVISRRFEQVGKTAHFCQEVILRIPKLHRTPKAPKLRLPKIAWRDATIRGELHARLTEKLTMLLATQASHVHLPFVSSKQRSAASEPGGSAAADAAWRFISRNFSRWVVRSACGPRRPANRRVGLHCCSESSD